MIITFDVALAFIAGRLGAPSGGDEIPTMKRAWWLAWWLGDSHTLSLVENTMDDGTWTMLGLNARHNRGDLSLALRHPNNPPMTLDDLGKQLDRALDELRRDGVGP